MKDKVYIVFEAEFGFSNLKFFTSFSSAKKYMGLLANIVAEGYRFVKKEYDKYPFEIVVNLSDDDKCTTCKYIQLRVLSGETLELIKFEKEYIDNKEKFT